ncbi:MAG: class I SAM-dependent methyltransferase [Cytophagaceae bacterium]|nr:class I SAM-dependent methyltransferase [Cytophagaceae bacterium]
MILSRLASFIRYFFSATNAHGIHSPFVYDLYTQIISVRKKYYAFEELKSYRQSLEKDNRKITLVDLGAGSFNIPTQPKQVHINTIYKRSSHSEKDTELLFRLVSHFQPHYILELGTCLGVSTLYLAKANKKASVYTLEGNPDYAVLARKAFIEFQTHNITLIEGNIHETLHAAMDRIPSLDFAFLDAHHAYEPTVQFFKTCLKKISEHSVIILDDIHWSPEMERAWETIKAMPEVKQTIDLFQFGIVFFKSGQVKEHFVLRYT